MLVLSRKPGERIVIGDNVEITVLRIHGNTVRLGIAAPRGVAINRMEVWHRIEEARPDVRPAGSVRCVIERSRDATPSHE